MTVREDDFRVDIAEAELTDLRDRLGRVRWTPAPAAGEEEYGLAVPVVRQLAEHWRDRYVAGARTSLRCHIGISSHATATAPTPVVAGSARCGCG